MNKSKLTAAEAETLAIMLNSASHAMCDAKNPDGTYASPKAVQAIEDMFTGFYQVAPDGIYISE